MSAIFKNRKIPKHLIIQEERPLRRRTRTSTSQVLGWVLLFSIVVWFALQYLAMLTL